MRTFASVLVCALVARTPLPAQSAPRPPISYVNTLLGTAPMDNPSIIGNAPPPGEALYTGHTTPGATLPHGRTALSPKNTDWDLTYAAGLVPTYNYLHRTMVGFTTAMPGVTVLPMVGEWTVPPQRRGSVYDKARERGTPGYYTVHLDDFDVTAEMTVTERTGMHRFTFPASVQSHLLIDLGRIGGTIQIVNDHTIYGCGDSTDVALREPSSSSTGRGSNMRCFVAVFSKPFTSFGTFHALPPRDPNTGTLLGRKSVTPGSTTDVGSYVGAYLNFRTTADEHIVMKTAVAESMTAAAQTLAIENPGWDFDHVRHRAADTWSTALDRIAVKGGTEHERQLFYSTLYLVFSSPHLLARRGETFAVRPDKITTATYDRYGRVGFWDVARSQLPLLCVLEPTVMTNVLRSSLDDAKETGYIYPSFHGDHGVLMYLGAWLRGVPFDYASAYPALRKNAMDPAGPRKNLQDYLDKGWVPDIVPPGSPSPPYAEGNAGVAKTLEYSWNDDALARYAQRLGQRDDARMFLQRAHNYRHVFDASVGFMRGKTADGRWITPFDPGEPYYNFMYKEASGWSMLWLVPHDVNALITMLGGRDRFNTKLDTFFATPYTAKGICRDCTGMIGQYAQGNEPDQQVPYYYDWSGQPWKTQALVRTILRRTYGSDRYGLSLPGNDDGGATSSWYVWSAMGLFPVNPATDEYAIGSPLFDEVTIHVSPGKDFVIVAQHNSAKNVYVQSATLNGKPLTKPWVRHADIVQGGRLLFVMGPTPNTRWGSTPDAAPSSMTPRSE